MTDFTKHPEPGDVDPYRYGPPPVGRQTPTGKQILGATWGLLKQDRELIALPIVGSLFALVAFAIFFVPSIFIGNGFDNNGHPPVAVYVGVILGGFLASIVSIFFQAGARGRRLSTRRRRRPDVQRNARRGLAHAAADLRVGDLHHDRRHGHPCRRAALGIVGKILGFLGGIAWAIATFFVVPVIVAEGLGPIEALKRSANTIKQVWGTSVRTTLRFGVIQFALTLAPMFLFIVGIVMAAAGILWWAYRSR